ncbi:hypothetical protein SAMN03159343_2076 [Klenkia marina]|uniref:Uncharacterized protein n=1 Tax=Klenkia marina TaxID=1960309 RepID=A0A1G4Y660_9ACTN|nr:hypothetical protein [Klenkia marina]SCX48967.1 hypothetical protein SAMN03159343_2076 [Klenkia marina]
MSDTNRAAALAAMAHQLRSGSRRYDPELISVSRLEEIRDRNVRLAAALGSDTARRQPATPSRAEQAEIDRVVADNAEWFTTTGDTQGTGR